MLKINTVIKERVYNYPVYSVEKATQSLMIWYNDHSYTEIKTNGKSSVGVCTRGCKLSNYPNIYILDEGESVTLTQE